MNRFIQTLRKFLLSLFFFLIPIFFLPITQEYYSTNKMYLGAFFVVLLLFLTTVSFIQKKTIRWRNPVFENSFFLIVLSVVLSVVIAAPNKIESILNMGVGLLPVLSMFLIYVITHQTLGKEDDRPLRFVMYSSLIIGISSIVFYFNPFKNVNLPAYLGFLKNELFSPAGSILDAAMFLGFFGVLGIVELFSQNNDTLRNIRARIIAYGTVSIFIIGLAFNMYILFSTIPQPIGNNTLSQKQRLVDQLTPYKVSWLAAVETLKSPINALFGAGPGNFVNIFTRVRPNEYNQTTKWMAQYGQSRNAILHIVTELGIFGLIAFGLLGMIMYRYINRLPKKERNTYQTGFAIFLVYSLILPFSYLMLFLFTAYIISLTMALKYHNLLQEDEKVFDVSKITPLYLGVIGLALIFITVFAYGLYRSYSAEYFFKLSLDGAVANNAQKAYENNRKAILANPYIERFRVNFSQLNLLIGNNIASKNQKDITEQDRQNITQAIQAAISEAKAAVSLNPQRAAYWENLAVIYRNVLNIAEGADAWTISSYQRAILQDPTNPSLRLALGGVYYTLGNFEEASKLFEQSMSLKPDWANAYYNYAWAMFQRREYQRAAIAMENVLKLVEKTSDDYKKAEKDLEEFKKMIPQESKNESEQVEKKGELTLPTPPVATFSPKIELPQEASPGARIP